AKAGMGMAGGMRAAVVLREQLDVLVQFTPIDLVLDAVVREMDPLVEVRQVVVLRPIANLSLGAVRTAIAVGASTVVFLQELLVLALQILLKDDAANLEVVMFLAESDFFLPVRRI